jgi:hypothetical protein
VPPHFATAIHWAAAFAVRISEKRCIMSKVFFDPHIRSPFFDPRLGRF